MLTYVGAGVNGCLWMGIAYDPSRRLARRTLVERLRAAAAPVHRAQHLDVADGVEIEAAGMRDFASSTIFLAASSGSFAWTK